MEHGIKEELRNAIEYGCEYELLERVLEYIEELENDKAIKLGGAKAVYELDAKIIKQIDLRKRNGKIDMLAMKFAHTTDCDRCPLYESCKVEPRPKSCGDFMLQSIQGALADELIRSWTEWTK